MAQLTLGTSVASTPTLCAVNGTVTALSTDVASHFGKQHNNVLRDIENLLQELPADRLLNFEQTVVERPNPAGGAPIQSRAYRLTRDGFTLLAMGFTGKKALAFKLAYLDAFNRMEAELSGRPVPIAPALPTAQPVPPAQPAIDVRGLLLSGQSNPVPLPPEVSEAIDKQAGAMAGQAFALAREHLHRRVAHRFITGSALKVNTKAALAHIATVGLNDALAHDYWAELHQVRGAATALSRMAQDTLWHMDAVLSEAQAKPEYVTASTAGQVGAL